MKTKHRSTAWQLILLVIVLAAVALFLLWRMGYMFSNQNDKTGVHPSVSKTVTFDTDPACKDALANLNSASFTSTCTTLPAYTPKQRKVTIVFVGGGTPAQLEKIQKLLDQYHAKATFLFDGTAASEEPDTVKMLRKKGNEIGNYGFEGEAAWQNMSAEDLTTSLAKTQAVLKIAAGVEPTYYTGNQTSLTSGILRCGAAAGLKTYIVPNCYLNYGSFRSFSAALGFAEKIPDGAIICVKLNDALSEEEYEATEVDQDPAEDKKASTNAKKTEPAEQSDIVNVVEYLLKSLYWTHTGIVPIGDYQKDPDPAVDAQFAEKDYAWNYQVAASDAKPVSWLDGSLFIGDSLTLGLQTSTDLDKTSTFCAYKSVSTLQFVNNTQVTDANGNKVRAWDAVRKAKPKRIYVLLGTNALASGNSDNLVIYYRRLILKLRKQFPNTPIYIEGMPPVTAKESESRPALSNWRIRVNNLEIAKLAKKMNCSYIDLYSAFADDDQAMPASYTLSDGIHMNASGCQVWVKTLLTHTATE